MNYCECQYGGSPSAHHDNCNSCHKKIKTIYEKYDELQAKLKLAEAEVIKRGENYNRLSEYARKMANPNDPFYISHSRQYEVVNPDGTKRMETVHYIKDIQQMAKDAHAALVPPEPKLKRKGFFENIHVYYGPEWDKDNE